MKDIRTSFIMRTIFSLIAFALSALAIPAQTYADPLRMASPAVYAIDKNEAKIVKVQSTSCNNAQLICQQRCAAVYTGQYNLCSSRPIKERTQCQNQAWSTLTFCSGQCISSNPCP